MSLVDVRTAPTVGARWRDGPDSGPGAYYVRDRGLLGLSADESDANLKRKSVTCKRDRRVARLGSQDPFVSL